MTRGRSSQRRILAIDPISRGLGFVVVETSPLRIVDWGVSHRNELRPLQQIIQGLLSIFRPTAVTIESATRARTPQRRRILTNHLTVIRRASRDLCVVLAVKEVVLRRVYQCLGVTTKAELSRPQRDFSGASIACTTSASSVAERRCANIDI